MFVIYFFYFQIKGCHDLYFVFFVMLQFTLIKKKEKKNATQKTCDP